MAYLNEQGLRTLVSGVRSKVIALVNNISNNLSNHVNNQNNPHNVTTTQISAQKLNLPVIFEYYNIMIGELYTNNVILMSSNNAQTVEIPDYIGYPASIGSQITFIQYGTGTTSFIAYPGVILRSKDSKISIDGQYSAVTLICVSQNEWILIGALA